MGDLQDSLLCLAERGERLGPMLPSQEVKGPEQTAGAGAGLSCLKTSEEQQEKNRRCKCCLSAEHCLLHTPKERNIVGAISSCVNSKGIF